jgi:hypothetical protein
LAAPIPRMRYLVTENQSAKAMGIVTTRAVLRLSSTSTPPKIRQHTAYSSPVSDRFSAMAAWWRVNGDILRPIR